MTKNSLITLYCIVDNFIHRFLETSTEKKNLVLYYGRHRPKLRMPVADVVTLNLVISLVQIFSICHNTHIRLKCTSNNGAAVSGGNFYADD